MCYFVSTIYIGAWLITSYPNDSWLCDYDSTFGALPFLSRARVLSLVRADTVRADDSLWVLQIWDRL